MIMKNIISILLILLYISNIKSKTVFKINNLFITRG